MFNHFCLGFTFIFVGYIWTSSFLQWAFYYRRAGDPERWKVQPNKTGSLKEPDRLHWWLPVLGLLGGGRRKAKRAPKHTLFGTVNLFMGSCIAGGVCHLIASGKTRVHWETTGYAQVAAGLAGSLAWQCVLEYYWHRLMHLPVVYARLHKHHHHYKSPEPFDDMYIHPLEALGYYLQLYSPPFVFDMPVESFGAYMVICGVCGVLDHSGVGISVPWLYDTADHDRHHSRFEVNYAFPLPFMDILHGTYEGTFLGWRF
ncbi:unnamed protein product, partial [Discosporangium mesarthrocarpum]